MRLELRKEDLFTFLLCCGYLHCLMEETTIKIADELYLTLHELMHWHEGGLLGSTKPVDQPVTNTGEPGNGIKVIPDAFVEVCLCTICIVWALLCNDARPLSQAYTLKAMTHEVE